MKPSHTARHSRIVSECTIAGNVASASGGGIDNFGSLYLLSDTVASNSASSGGGLRDEVGGAALISWLLATLT